ncbi:MAG: carboxypeptidase-like regulatory domain-containing protein [Planctomycetota bacterium]|jgi:hypothetical protein
MRLVILCIATFAAGILAGTMFDSGPPANRGRSRDDAGPQREYRVTTGHARGELDFLPDGSRRGSGSESTDVNVRALASQASRKLEEITTSDRAAALQEGEGKVTGTVRDPKGNAVAGVIITATPEVRPFELTARGRQARQKSHENRDLGDVAQSAIQNELWRRYARRTAATDVNGRFELHGLMDARHVLTAFHDKFEIVPLNQRNRVQPDAVVDFAARPVVTVRVEVQLPDGKIADHAWLSWEGPHGKNNDAWLREPGTVRLPVGNCKVKAYLSLPEPMESEEIEQVLHTTPPTEPIVLKLSGRKILTARLAMPEGYGVPSKVEYRMRRVDSDEIEPESLLQDQSQRLARTPSPGRAHWYDLEPGRYLIAAFLNRRRLLAHAIAEVGEGPAEVELPVEEAEPGSYVKVRLTGPDGGPVPGNVSFRVITGPENRPKTQNVDALQGDESWLVFIDKVSSKDSSDASMRVGTRDFGGAIERFSLRGGGTIQFRFDKPSKLNLQIDRYQGSGVEGSLFVALRGKLGADAWRQVSPDGSCDLNGVQPGEYKLMLYVRQKGQNYPIFQREMRMRAGEDEMSLAMPSLHTLKVRWAGKGRPSNVTLRCRDESVGRMRRTARLRGKTASFPLLAAGTYELECNRKRATVRVPGAPEFVLK